MSAASRTAFQILLTGMLSWKATTAQAAVVSSPTFDGIQLAVCRIDLRQDQLRTFWRNPQGHPYASLPALAAQLKPQGLQLVCAVNAGIYEQSLRPLGLYIEQGKTWREANPRSSGYGNFYMQPNGVFLVHAGRAEIVSTRAWLKRTDMQRAAVQYATQSGPLLLVDGKINPQFDPASRNKTVRNAVCVQDAQTVSLVTTGTPVSFYQFASLLQQRLGCQSALYLDGAISTFYPAPFLTPQVQLGPMLGVVAPVSPP